MGGQLTEAQPASQGLAPWRSLRGPALVSGLYLGSSFAGC